jgi:hypothetical protein
MRQFLAATLIAFALSAAPALAGEPEKPKGAAGQYVDVSAVALPIVENGRLINFVFVTLRLDLVSSANAVALRDKEPYFRDALVHTAYRQPFNLAGSYIAVDVRALKARMMVEAARIVGPGVVTGVELVGEPQPKRVTGLPRPPAAAAGPRAPIP